MCAADHGADARQKFPRVERLCHIVVSAEFKADDAIGVLGDRCEKDDRRRCSFAQGAAKRNAILSRHHDIQDDQIERPRFEVPAGFCGISRRRHPHAVLHKKLGEQVSNVLMIVDDKNMKRSLHGLSFGLCLKASTSKRSIKCVKTCGEEAVSPQTATLFHAKKWLRLTYPPANAEPPVKVKLEAGAETKAR